MRNGSLLVFRRLRQKVDEFRRFLEDQAREVSAALGTEMSARQVGAAVVGRWEDGTPTTLSPGREDAEISGDGFAVNHFAYGGLGDVRVAARSGPEPARVIPGHPSDEAGLRCPHFAHVRKVNPRNLRTDQGAASRTLIFQMMRRGIPYGPAFEPGREDDDRGLLFLAYQTSFTDQFRILNNLWMNNPDAPERGDEGHDLLVGQNELSGPRFGSFRDALGNERARLHAMSHWVIPTGGAFLFSPPLNFFDRLRGN
jgi:Dyp-type peroxidase family